MINHMDYGEGMEVIPSDIMNQVMKKRELFHYNFYKTEDVLRALNEEHCSIEDFAALLSPAAEPFLEEMAKKAQGEIRKYFGNSVYLFTPIYISNYCDNYCVYCGFNCHNNIKRARLSYDEIEEEMKKIAQTGLEEILILTGESKIQSDLNYIGEACNIAKKYFKMIGLEVYPMNTEEYAYLHECGADYITVFQETYEPTTYEKLHLSGHKRVFPYRMNAQERAILGGMRGVAFAALLGLDDFRKDAFATGVHAYLLQKKYPHAEISFSCPRIRPIINGSKFITRDVTEKNLFQVMCAYRIFMPYAGMTISTRESETFRNHVIGVCATKISAGVSTGVGGHQEKGVEQGDDQFLIADTRGVEEVYQTIKTLGLQPVMNEYVYV